MPTLRMKAVSTLSSKWPLSLNISATASADIIAPGAYDTLTARMVQVAGFQAVYLTGGGYSRANGYPDIGLVTMPEMVQNARFIAEEISQIVAALKRWEEKPANVTHAVLYLADRITRLKAEQVGTVTATATVTEVDRRRVVFDIRVEDDTEVCADGRDEPLDVPERLAHRRRPGDGGALADVGRLFSDNFEPDAVGQQSAGRGDRVSVLRHHRFVQGEFLAQEPAGGGIVRHAQSGALNALVGQNRVQEGQRFARRFLLPRLSESHGLTTLSIAATARCCWMPRSGLRRWAGAISARARSRNRCWGN